ncbi:Hypothetical protein PACV_148 [Pacmanvirus A23]|uniref:Hypothetical protein n=1 Tax=Pacmanvirus A23 TaxID=1932881 RepID=UPI000A095746|nr:Hypothetical protein B9W72_gp146 [Pacmanvirus A23]SIP85863.1 Hypothetical protein PACV_148 [Pacmanvirus A23]
MVKEEIVNYYLLCTVRNGKRKHIVSELPDKKLNVLFTGKEKTLFFREQNGELVARESVIGGNDEPVIPKRGIVTIIY